MTVGPWLSPLARGPSVFFGDGAGPIASPEVQTCRSSTGRLRPSVSAGVRHHAGVVDPSLLLVSDDAVLHTEVARLAAAANVSLEPTDAADAAERWRTAGAVLVGDDAVRRLAALVPGRRDDVWVLSSGGLAETQVRAALALGASGLVELPSEATLLAGWLADLGDRTAETVDRGRVLGVLGASGGVGASILALAVAETAAPDGGALLVDLDPWGLPAGALAGVAAEEPDLEQVTWAELVDLEGRVGGRALRESLPARDSLRVLGWAAGDAAREPPPAVVREVAAAGRRGHGWVVLDLPRSGTVREALALCDAVVVVAAPTLAGTAGAARVRTLLPAGVAAGVVVRAGKGVWPADVARLTGLPLWGTLDPQRGLEEHLAAGLGAVRARRSPCARAAREVLAEVRRVERPG